MSSTGRHTIKFEVSELLNGQNYHSWKKDIRMLLNGEEAYKITIGSELPPNPNATAQAREYNRRAARAATILYQSVDPIVQAIINNMPDEESENPSRIWEVLRKEFDTAMLPSGRLDILNRFHTSSMKPDMPTGEYISQLLSIRQELDGTPDALTENTFIAHILRTLPESYAIPVGILKNQPANEQTLRNVATTLKEHQNSFDLRKLQAGSGPNRANTTVMAEHGRIQNDEIKKSSKHPYRRNRPRG